MLPRESHTSHHRLEETIASNNPRERPGWVFVECMIVFWVDYFIQFERKRFFKPMTTLFEALWI